MPEKVIKVVKQLGQCNDTGLSFHQDSFIEATHAAFTDTQLAALQREAVTTGPARVYILIEQDIIE